jgi:hypothetical protein
MARASAPKKAAPKKTQNREPKTKPTDISVKDFIAAVADETKRADANAIDKLMRAVTGEKPQMWGASIIGYGTYQSPTGPWPITGFSPRKANLVIYVMDGYANKEALMAKLGKHKTGKSCLYINKLADVDQSVLREIVAQGVAYMRKTYK